MRGGEQIVCLCSMSVAAASTWAKRRGVLLWAKRRGVPALAYTAAGAAHTDGWEYREYSGVCMVTHAKELPAFRT